MNTKPAMNTNNEMLLAIPVQLLQQLLDNQSQILAKLDRLTTSGKEGIGDYIPESEAKKVLGRNTTWFWDMRTKGKLAFTKIGSKVFYTRKDIEMLLAKGRKEAYRK
jgi:hypothetical protein